MSVALWVVGGWIGLNVALLVFAVIGAAFGKDRPLDVHEMLDAARAREDALTRGDTPR